MTGTYVYVHYVGDRPIYVGMGSVGRAFNTKNRLSRWRELTKDGYRVDFVFWSEDRKKASAKEIELIKNLKPECNMIHNGWIHPIMIGNQWNIGRKHSEETKRKLSSSQKISWEKTKRGSGRRRPTKPIKCLETGIIYDGLREAARQTGAHPSGISECINGKKQHAAGLRFVRLEN